MTYSAPIAMQIHPTIIAAVAIPESLAHNHPIDWIESSEIEEAFLA